MSVELLNDFGVGNFNLTAITETINRSYKGKNEVTLSNYDGTGAPAVKVGSVFDNNGALYIVSGSDETPSGYAGITVSTTFYLVFDVSALAFIYSETAPTWSDSMQGWYNGNDRYLFSMLKDSGGTLYESKYLLAPQNNVSFANDVSITNDLYIKETVYPKYYYRSDSAVSNGTVYDAISDWVPNVGDLMNVSGGFRSDASGNELSLGATCIVRTTSTFIQIQGVSYSTFTSTTSAVRYAVDDGGATTIIQSIVLKSDEDKIAY